MGPSLPPSHCLVGAAMAAPTGADQACRAAESRRPKIRYRIQASSVTPAEPSIVCTEEEANSRMQAISAPMPSSRSHVDGRRSRVPITRLRPAAALASTTRLTKTLLMVPTCPATLGDHVMHSYTHIVEEIGHT